MKVAVIGAGWAGLSAAVELHLAGHQITVYESGHKLGGRARGLHSPKLNTTLDNGQHIMLGAYTETLALMRRLGLNPDALLYSMPLALQSASGDFALRVPNAPQPLALPAALLCAKGISWLERLRLATLMSRLSQLSGLPPSLTVLEWLTQGKQSSYMVRNFWEPLCLAAMNTPLNQTCAQLFANVLRDSLGAGPRACRVLISRTDLSSLWPEQLPAGIRVVRGHTVRRLEAADAFNNAVLVDGQAFDAVVVATNVQSARRLLGQLPTDVSTQQYLSMLDAFKPLPIATLTLDLSGMWNMPHSMLMLADAPEQGRFGQWLFHCNVFMDEPLATSRLNIVISHAVDLPKWPAEQIMEGVVAQITEQTQGRPPLPSVRAYELITEKRATFAAEPNLKRPANITPWQHVYVAGDWTDTGYPAVLEGAVRSGLKAAEAVLQTLSPPRQSLV